MTIQCRHLPCKFAHQMTSRTVRRDYPTNEGIGMTRRPQKNQIASLALALAFSLGGTALMFWHAPVAGGESAVSIPPPAVDEHAAARTSEKAVLAGGCFWGVQGVFEHVKGVTRAVSGYAGGARADAHYETVSGGRTGHAESVEITFDPRQITYGQLLQIYFSVAHDPTQENRQSPDVGTQYRSTVFALDADQQKAAQSYIAQLDKAGVYPKPIATTIEMGKSFYPAESHHQDFLVRNPTDGYIVVNDLPKVANLQRLFPDRYRAQPMLVGVAVHAVD